MFEVFFYLPKFLLLSLVFTYIYISQDSVKTYLRCDEMCNNRVIVNCLQSVLMKKFEN